MGASRFWTEDGILLLHKHSGPIEARQIVTLAKLVFDNAQGLLTDAEFLLSHDRLARAVFLAIAAIEEIGKVPIVISAFLRLRTDEQWRQFWKRFRSHHTKLLMATLGEVVVLEEETSDQGLRTLLNVVPRRQKWREMCLYVDCYDGHVLSPTSFAEVGELRRMASDLVSQAKLAVGVLGFIPQYFSADRLEAVLTHHRDSLDWDDPRELTRFLSEFAKKSTPTD
jgi:AbiV family abortive infection protein